MKTTNFEISKKLKEIGFEAECSYLWFEKDQAIVFHHGWIHPINEVERINKEAISYIPKNSKNYPAYDLETLIEALPDSFTREYKSTKDGTIRKFKEKLLISKNEIWYKCYDIETSDDANEYWREYGYEQNISIYSWDDSLANIAGKMLIKLYEAGIINFNK